MRITVDKCVFGKFPQLQIALFLVKNIDNKQRLKESQHLIKETMVYLKQSMHEDNLRTHNLISPWKTAREEFGLNAYHYHTSVEKLLKKVLRGGNIVAKDSLTNVLNYLSLKHIVPLGVDDASKFEKGLNGKITFSIANDKKRLGWLRHLQSGDLYYRDETNILGTKLDFWKNKKTAVGPKTNTALIHLEALPPVSQEEFQKITLEVRELVKGFCGGTVRAVILNSTKREATFV